MMGSGRSLWQVLALYAGASWLALQVVDVLKDNMGLPDWVFPFALVLLLIGLPIIVATALVQARASAGAAIPAGSGADQPAVAPSIGGAGAEGEPSASRRLLTWKNALLGGALAFVLLALVTGGFMYMRGAGIGPVGSLVAAGVLEEKARVVLADIEADEPTLSRTVTESFRVDLGQSPVIRLVGSDSIADALARMGRGPEAGLDEATARELAQRDGIPAVIAGELATLGSGYVLTARLVDASDGTVLASARASARDDEAILAAIDEVSSRLRERIGESYTSLRGTPELAHVTTGSLAALKKYTEAYDARHRDEDPEAAVRLLEEAVAIDSTFALAWRDLATVLDNMGRDRGRQAEALEQAYKHRDRLSERERYLVEASYHSELTRDWEKATEAYQAMLRLDPDDAQALNNIGANYYAQADYENALVWYRRAHAADPGVSLHLANVAITEANLGHFDSAAARYAELDSFPPNPLFEEWEAQFRWLLGDEEAFRAGLERYGETFPGGGPASNRVTRSLEGLEVLHGRVSALLAEAEERAERSYLAGDVEESVDALLDVAGIRLEVYADTAGAVAAALETISRVEADPATREDPPWWQLGNLLFEAGDVEQGQAYRDSAWQRSPEPLRRWRASRQSADLRYRVARAEGSPEEALRSLRALPPWTCVPCRHRETARLFDEAGRADSAVVYFELYLETPYNFRFWEDATSLARTHERLGQLYDERGDLEKAALHLARFVELWEDADPEFQPRVTAARERLEAILRERG
jgi:tetratricopeptide (TPR) repeat protein